MDLFRKFDGAIKDYKLADKLKKYVNNLEKQNDLLFNACSYGVEVTGLHGTDIFEREELIKNRLMDVMDKCFKIGLTNPEFSTTVHPKSLEIKITKAKGEG